MLAYLRQGRGVRVAIADAQSNPSCRTKSSHFDRLYPLHLGELPKVRLSTKKDNFPPSTGFHLV